MQIPPPQRLPFSIAASFYTPARAWRSIVNPYRAEEIDSKKGDRAARYKGDTADECAGAKGAEYISVFDSARHNSCGDSSLELSRARSRFNARLCVYMDGEDGLLVRL